MKYPKVKNPNKLPGSWVRKAKKVSRKNKCLVTLWYDGIDCIFVLRLNKNELKEIEIQNKADSIFEIISDTDKNKDFFRLFIQAEIDKLHENNDIDPIKVEHELDKLKETLGI